eukprot:CAMPEP_0195036840 /NCGR_PEP_ID=MMETSP0326_2-20130528/73504_1 /TAXON_ID=2866 ORGANISM="Crypthecodinium cohnii, Strain Seligo" /NCGR_SAMPLE_ID=MMETSP0326_2 /ASSEMBLY_ACC=CAM_ASM_000348 /LENGTH=190 /DNA_ID=CAMNT_0040062593 /DNA_START=23 /DNA_END=596 /DNA_ORIENTATION=-
MGLDPKRKPGSIPEDVQEKAADEDKENKTPLAKLASKSVDEFARMISAKGLKEHYQRRMAELREKQRTAAMEVAITIGRGEGPKEAVWPSSSVRIAAGVKVSCQDGSSVAAFKRGEDTLNLPIAPTASFLISDLSDGQPHVVKSLRCADPFEESAFAKFWSSKVVWSCADHSGRANSKTRVVVWLAQTNL